MEAKGLSEAATVATNVSKFTYLGTLLTICIFIVYIKNKLRAKCQKKKWKTL